MKQVAMLAMGTVLLTANGTAAWADDAHHPEKQSATTSAPPAKGPDKSGACGQPMSPMAHDMSAQMKQMSEMMMTGTMDPAMQKQMAERMQSMAAMMEQMSGMMGHGMMMNPDAQKQMDDMRKRMDEMNKQPMAPAKK